MSPITRAALLSLVAVLTEGCRSGGGDAAPAPATYTVGGSVTGLSGSGLVLQNNGGNNLPIGGPGTFSFSAPLSGGASYAVSVFTQPSNPTQTCVVSAGGSGTIATASITNVVIGCTTNTYAVSGNVTGLSGAGLVLQNNGANDLTIDADGAFMFPALVASGSGYSVTVDTQPSGGSEYCSVSNGDGTIGGAAATNVNVTCSPAPAGFVYVPNQGSNDVSAYAINPNTGELSVVPGSPFPAAPSPAVASLDPSGRFLYVSSRGSPATPPVVSGYAVDAGTGALTPLPGSPFALSVAVPPASGQVSEIGRFLIHSSGLFGYLTVPYPTGRIYGLALNPVTGVLTEVSGMPIELGYALFTGTYATTGSFIYFPHISSPPDGFVTSYSIHQTSGVLTPVGSFRIQSRGATMAVLAPADEYLLTPNQYFPNVSLLDVDPTFGTMVPVAGSPIPLTPMTTAPFSLAYHRGGNFFYVTDSASPTVFGFRLNTATTSVTALAGSPYTAGTGQVGPAVLDPQERFLFVPLRTANAVQVYALDPASGALAPVAGTPFATEGGPAVVPDPSGRFLFVSNTASHSISSFAIDQTSGALTLINTLATGQSPQSAEVLVP
jgi:6-phosphogluconolactonase